MREAGWKPGLETSVKEFVCCLQCLPCRMPLSRESSFIPSLHMRHLFDPDRDREPVMWLAGRPIYMSAFLALVFSLSMVLTTLLMAFGKGQWLVENLGFSSTSVFSRGAIWQFVTYAFVNAPDIWFVISMLFLWFAGKELQQFFGRSFLLKFYILATLVQPAVALIAGAIRPMDLVGASSGIAVLIALAVVYPGFPLIFGVPAKWVAIIIVAIAALQDLASRDWAGLVALIGLSGFALTYVKVIKGDWTLPQILPKGTHLRVLRNPLQRAEALRATQSSTRVRTQQRTVRTAPVTDPAPEEVDALLDKIAQHGMNSLSDKERERLERARQRLLDNDAR